MSNEANLKSCQPKKTAVGFRFYTYHNKYLNVKKKESVGQKKKKESVSLTQRGGKGEKNGKERERERRGKKWKRGRRGVIRKWEKMEGRPQPMEKIE